ncbi:DUF2384 domain-containing protein [Bradyrhizobium sp. 83012]|uniref:DUF2384 domain-containing protein n=1 Tax=Bradyrhizobium aeschynomenes TaxID=2734909 RepID=A0ABX2C6Q8_9BRAD|nr:DUF2384 domain-containing protein [Bradyrhizobium aeschynomenes]
MEKLAVERALFANLRREIQDAIIGLDVLWRESILIVCLIVDRPIKKDHGDFRKVARLLASTQGADDVEFLVIESPAARVRQECLEIIHRISDWAGGEEAATFWFRSEPLPAFGGRTAEALVKEGRAETVRNFLDHVALGGFA